MKTMSMDFVERFKDLTIKTTIKTGIEGKSFGSITSSDVALLLDNNGIEIDKKNIILEEPIKHPGVYDIKVHLAEGVKAVFKLVVIEEGA
jgi:large subunit ribosomal protein L9